MEITAREVIADTGNAVRRIGTDKSAFGRRITLLKGETAADFEEVPYETAAREADEENNKKRITWNEPNAII